MQKVPVLSPTTDWRSGVAGNILFMHLPATFAALGMVAGLSVDTYRAWKRDEAVADCKARFVVELYDIESQIYTAGRADSDGTLNYCGFASGQPCRR